MPILIYKTGNSLKGQTLLTQTTAIHLVPVKQIECHLPGPQQLPGGESWHCMWVKSLELRGQVLPHSSPPRCLSAHNQRQRHDCPTLQLQGLACCELPQLAMWQGELVPLELESHGRFWLSNSALWPCNGCQLCYLHHLSTWGDAEGKVKRLFWEKPGTVIHPLQ